MKHLALTAIAVGLLAVGPAIAADMPLKAPIMAPVPWSWTGFYIGGNVGAGWGNKWWDNNDPLDNAFFFGFPGTGLGTTSMDGFLGGGQVGFNWQNGLAVFGIETTWSWTDMKGHFAAGLPGTLTITPTSKLDWIGTVVGRVGVSVDHAFLYVGAGAAWTKEEDGAASFGPGFGGVFGSQNISYSASQTESGWTFLTGLEYAFSPNWSARLQYNFYDFENNSIKLLSGNPATTAITGATLGVSTPLRIHAIAAGLNFRFGP
jgi:outer membrane immunogenic protein